MATASTKTVWDALTLTGISLAEVYAAIDCDLGTNAYKDFTGTGGFRGTDIKPPFVYEVLADCFGPCGIGWGFEVKELTYVGSRTYKTQAGKERVAHYAGCRILPWYRLAEAAPFSDETGRVELPESTGGSENAERQYAEQGAITNALGKALSYLGMQRHIYKNEPAPEAVEPEAPVEMMTPAQRRDIFARSKELGYDEARTKDILTSAYHVANASELTYAQAEHYLKRTAAAIAKLDTPAAFDPNGPEIPFGPEKGAAA